MINAVTGDIVNVSQDMVILKAGAIEYQILIDGQTSSKLSMLKGEDRLAVRLVTYLVHREDAMLLYGFLDEKTREIFLQLLSVQGIGARGALKILGGTQVKSFVHDLDEGNVKALSKLPGVGAKTAQRLVLALRNRLVIEDETAADGGVALLTDSSLRPYHELIDAFLEMGYDRKRIETGLKAILTKDEEVLKSLDRDKAEQKIFKDLMFSLS
ncbi:MAG: Holliday junction branch migration protein RuvA [Spirochaetia bacterium]|jgi:Holliday junction DNA helicase RuvA|nr:Holliday junction branch migration protein RuvA [Spirochaetia bacterium]